MDFLKSGLKTVLGTPEPGTEPTGAETVEKLVDRLTSSTLLEDRRNACRTLKALSRTYRVEVGAQGMPSLIQVLQTDQADCEIIGYALDTLCNITSQELFDEEVDNPIVTVNIGEQFTEMFIKSSENVTLVLGFLEEYDFKVRWPAIKLLTGLLTNKLKDIQEIVLVSPMGVSKLMDLLIDSREIIRNDALLLLIQLTKGNANIQKIVAFENAFDRLFDVIRDEGSSDGGIVVEDCFLLMLNLLKNNSSNQQFFKEGSYIQRLAPMLVMPADLEESGWSPQRVANVHCMLQIVRALVSPSNSQQVVSSCQKTMRSSGLLDTLSNILMASGVPADILTETINTVAEVVRGDISNQEYLSKVMAPSNPPRPAIVVLLMSMVNEKQPLGLRCAVLYCFESFLYRNELGQLNLIQTLLPSSTEVSSLTTGQLLCGGLFSGDALANWFSSVALMYGLIENPVQKEQLLRVLLASGTGNTPISLLHQCIILLQHFGSNRLQSKVGLLMLISTWLSHSQLAVKTFLNAPNSIGYLITQIGANEHDENEYLVQGLCAFLMGICIQFNDNSVQHLKRDDLMQLIIKRIGIETFTNKLGEVSKHESYSKAGKQPQIRISSHTDLLLDYEFCKLFKALEALIVKTINGFGKNDDNNVLELNQEVSGVVGQYKDIIREQDAKIQLLQTNMKTLETTNAALKLQLDEVERTKGQLVDQNILLKAQLTAASELVNKANTTDLSQLSVNGPDPHAGLLQAENDRLNKELEHLKLTAGESCKAKEEKQCELEKLRKDQEDLLELLTDQETKINRYRVQLKSLGQPISDDEEDDGDKDINLR